MIVVREVFTAKPGQASKLAKLLRKGFRVTTSERKILVSPRRASENS